MLADAKIYPVDQINSCLKTARESHATGSMACDLRCQLCVFTRGSVYGMTFWIASNERGSSYGRFCLAFPIRRLVGLCNLMECCTEMKRYEMVCLLNMNAAASGAIPLFDF